MLKRDLVAQVYWFRIHLYFLLDRRPDRLLPDLYRYKMRFLFHLRDCICKKIQKVQP